MSLASRNPFAMLDEDGDGGAPAPATQAAQTTKATTPAATTRQVPGLAPTPAQQRGRGRGRGGRGGLSGGDIPEPIQSSTATEEIGMSGSGPTEVRGAPRDHNRAPRLARGGADAYKKDAPAGAGRGGRGGRGSKDHGGPGRGWFGGPKNRTYDRHSGTHGDTTKKQQAGWGNDDQELEAETLADQDAKAEVNQGSSTPVGASGAVNGDAEAAKGDTAANGAELVAPVVDEEEDKTMTMDEYLKLRAEKQLNISRPELRRANEGVDESQWGDAKPLTREQEETLFAGKKPSTRTNVRPKKENKQLLEIEQRFAAPPSSPGPRTRGSGRGRGEGRGRGRGDSTGGYSDRAIRDPEARGRGGRGGFRGRGGGRGGYAGSNQTNPPNLNDQSAFPSLG